jgi:hypothetical protein
MKENRIKVTKIRNNTVVGVIVNGIEMLATNKCRTIYNLGNPVRTIKYTLN